ncbi:hypothetical protein ACJJTC_005218 [Scirpophaga incertulas]
MAHLQYIPGDPRLVDQLVYELKSKGIFDQFRKDCIADVDTRPAYQNLRQRVENSVTTFLARQCWMPDLNKNQLREKLRKHILDGNYLEQGVERIVDQVVNPKVASVFIPQVEDLVYNYLGITRKKTSAPETSNGKIDEASLLPTDLEAVSPGSVKSNDDKNEVMDIQEENKTMEVDELKEETKEDNGIEQDDKVKQDTQDSQLSGISELTCNNSNSSIDKNNIPLPSDDIKVENIPPPEKSPPDSEHIQVDIDKIQLPADEPNNSMDMDIPLPEEISVEDKDRYFKPVNTDEESSSDSSLIRNMSPLTPIRNFNNENSCDAQQAFENQSVDIQNDKTNPEPNSFRFTIEAKVDDSSDAIKSVKQDGDQKSLSYQFANQININNFNTPVYEDSSNSNLLQIDYESDPNSKQNIESKNPDEDQNSNEVKKGKKQEERKSSHKSSSNRDSSSKDKERRHSNSKDRRSDKPSNSKDNKSDRKSSKDDHKSSSKSSHKERHHDKSEKKDSRDSSKHRSSSHKSSSHKDSKAHRSSSSTHKHSSSSKHADEKKSSSHKDKDKSSKDEKYSKDKSSRDTKSSSNSHRSDKDKKSSGSSKSKHDDKDKKKSKKETDDHYSASGRGSHNRRSTDRDSNDGSSSSKGSHNPSNPKQSDSKKSGKSSASKSDTTSTTGESNSPSDKEHIITAKKSTDSINIPQIKPIRVENHLEFPVGSPPKLPFVPEVKLRKPKIAANLEEAKRLMKMRKFLDEEQKRMNQEAALLLEFQANVRPSMTQVYSSIPGPELEFACIKATPSAVIAEKEEISSGTKDDSTDMRNDSISDILNAAEQVDNIDDPNNVDNAMETLKMNSEIDDESDTTNTATVAIENITNTIEIVNKTTNNNTLSKKIKNSKVKKQKKDFTIKNHENEDLYDRKENSEQVARSGDAVQCNLTKSDNYLNFEVTVIAENVSDVESIILETSTTDEKLNTTEDVNNLSDSPVELEYFAEHEKYSAELERDRFSKFLKGFLDKNSEKMFLVNCDAYEESIVKEVSESFGNYNIVNCYKNGYLKLKNTAKNVVRNVNISSEIVLPVENITDATLVFSPVKSEFSFEFGCDYVAKLEEMVSKTSRKEIMEIILGGEVEDSLEAVMPTIDYCSESSIASEPQETLKRKLCDMESSENNNGEIRPPAKLRILSGSDEISSTTEESDVTRNNNVTNNSLVRSKYLGKARRVGLPKPRRSNLPNSPSSDKSIENYEQNTPVVLTPNGKIKLQRNKVQRYDTSELYKPKLHYLSRRNNIS